MKTNFDVEATLFDGVDLRLLSDEELDAVEEFIGKIREERAE